MKPEMSPYTTKKRGVDEVEGCDDDATPYCAPPFKKMKNEDIPGNLAVERATRKEEASNAVCADEASVVEGTPSVQLAYTITIHVGRDLDMYTSYNLQQSNWFNFYRGLGDFPPNPTPIHQLFVKDAPEEFDLIIEWIRSNGTKMTAPAKLIGDSDQLLHFWIRISQLAQRLKMVNDCQIFIKERTYQHARPEIVSISHIDSVLELPPKNPVRLLLLDVVAFELIFPGKAKSTFNKVASKYSAQILRPVLGLLKSRRKGTDSLHGNLAAIPHPTKAYSKEL